jgi:hypothetical protein
MDNERIFNVTPISPAATWKPDLDTAGEALARARGIVDLLQGAAAHGAIEPPSNEGSLADTLEVVLGLLDEVKGAVLPPDEG